MTGRSTPTEGAWPGCHGVRITADPDLGLDLGRATGEPLLDAQVTPGPVPVAAAAGTELWRLTADVDGPHGPDRVEQALLRGADGTLVLQTSRGEGVAVDVDARTIVVAAPARRVAAQLVATYAVPLLVPAAGALVVHGAAAAWDDRAVLVCGRSGRGKSSLLVALADAGWAPISEDLCALDRRGPVPVVWPGPPWVRRLLGEPGPVGATPRFGGPDKTAWDVGGRQPDRALPLAAIAFLDQPGGDAELCEDVPRAARVAELASHVVWLDDPDRGAAATFPAVVDVTSAVRCVRLRFPRRASWLDGVPEVLAALLER